MYYLYKFILSFFYIFFITSAIVFAQYEGAVTPLHLPKDTLFVNKSNAKTVYYHNETVFVFDNYYDGTKNIIAPDEMNDGKYIAFFKNDTTKPKMEVSYYNRKKHGMLKKYNDDGSLYYIENYRNGIFIGKTTYMSNEKIKEIVKCNDKSHNCVSTRYDAGSSTKIVYKKNKTIIKIFNLNGEIIGKQITKDGKIIRDKKYGNAPPR